MKRRIACFFAATVIAAGAIAFAEGELLKPTDEKPATPKEEAKPAQKAPEEAKATVSEDAQKLIDQINEAYGKLKSLELAGNFHGHIAAGGQESGGDIPFTATYQAPNKFRHSTKNEVLAGSTGEKVYAYVQHDNIYALSDAPKDKVATRDMPDVQKEILTSQDPSLRLALSRSPAAELVDGVKDVCKAPDTKIGDVDCPTLKLKLGDDTLLTIAVDPSSHLIRRTNLDLRAELERRKIPDIKEATYTIDYSTVTPDAAVKDDAFAWAPPAGAKDIKDIKETAAPGDEDSAAMALVGKDAPDFKLTGVDGKTVTKADMKGKVYVLDFWATWCPPCRASLPHLDKLYQAEKANGLSIYAVNCKEEKDTVEKFIEKTKLGVPVLLDSDGAAAEAYKAEGIPETVIIGKDGKVAKVIVGLNPEGVNAAVKAVMAK